MAGRINRRLSNSRLEMVPGASAYLDWFLQTNINRYFKQIRVVGTHRDFLRDCYTRCANLEADIGLARHLLRVDSMCWAEACAAGDIVLEQAVHPLLAQPAELSLTLHGKGAFISGQNGIGKSTLLRTVGLNLMVARAFGFCYAGEAKLPMLPVCASMQSEDSLLGGESLYIAELQRAQELLAVAKRPHRVIFIIDEIFRGTNHLESVSAAAAVLEALAAKDTVIVSSHNLVLASLLEHHLAPFCVVRDEAGALFLAPGVLTHTNGIALLAERGFGPAIEARAAKVFDWLSTYLAQPRGDNQMLCTSENPARTLAAQ
jgi:DNA mismatch repair ATPase MutS